jgi:adenosylmethionine-8-amino-7-oxononanoate aminotransferase
MVMSGRAALARFAISTGCGPDLMTMAKGLIPAYAPLGAVYASEIANFFQPGLSRAAYNSHPISLAAAIAQVATRSSG